MNRRHCCLSTWICLSAVLSLGGGAGAHVGDRVIPIYEVPSSDIPAIDDFSLFEWENIVPEPSLESLDFSSLQVGSPSSADLAVRVYLAWNMATQRLYLALERTDDIYINEYFGGDAPNFIGADHARAVALMGNPLVAVVMLMFIIASFYHSQLGLQVVIEDYIQHEGLKTASVLAVSLGTFALGIASVFAVLKLSFGG